MIDSDRNTDLARKLVETLLDEIDNGRTDAPFLQVVRQVIKDSGVEMMADASSKITDLQDALPRKPQFKTVD
tara:strand:- start:37 stop:252 length:216 start_codon:yes stop_codon:yes gene_type:complete